MYASSPFVGMTSKARFLTSVILMLACLEHSATAQPLPRYRAVEIGHFGFDGPNEVEAVNNVGHAVGWSIVDRHVNENQMLFITRGHVWRGENSEQLPSVADGEFSWASDINDDGIIVGRAQRANGEIVACQLSTTEGAQPLPLNGATGVSANSINRDGLIVGGARTTDGRLIPYFFDRANGNTQIIDVDGTGVGLAVNDSGLMVGRYLDPGGTGHPFRVRFGEDFEDLNSLLPQGSLWTIDYALDINNQGTIVGTGWYDGERRSFRGNFDGSDPELLPPLPGDTESYVSAINDAGLAVGFSYYFVRPAARWTGVVWTSDSVIDINGRIADAPAGLRFEGVRGLNNRGTLVARGVRQAVRQYVLTPICAGDRDVDGDVDLQDLALFLSCYADAGCPHDLDEDGDVDVQDLAWLLSQFGGACP